MKSTKETIESEPESRSKNSPEINLVFETINLIFASRNECVALADGLI